MLSAPSSVPAQTRILYSLKKQIVVEAFEDSGNKLNGQIDIQDIADIDEKTLYESVHPPQEPKLVRSRRASTSRPSPELPIQFERGNSFKLPDNVDLN